MANAYERLEKAVGYLEGSIGAKRSGDPLSVRQTVAGWLSQEYGEQTEARIIMDYDETPIEKAHEGLERMVKISDSKVGDLADNSFKTVLRNAPAENLKGSVMGYAPKPNVSTRYKKAAKGHEVELRIDALRNAKDEAEGKAIAKNVMLKDVQDYYEEAYENKSGDNDYVKEQNALIKDFLLSLHVTNGGEPRVENVLKKYVEVNEEERKEFKEKTKTKAGTIDYIEGTMPEELEARKEFFIGLGSSR